MNTEVYLDNNASTSVANDVKDYVCSNLSSFGNPSSHHHYGYISRKTVELSRKISADYLCCRESEIVFTSGGTESIGSSFSCALETREEKRTIIISSVEHAAVFSQQQQFIDRGHHDIVVPVDGDGRLDLNFFEKACKEHPGAFVSMIYANNETGVIFPVKKIVQIAKEQGALVHIDAVQAVGKLTVNVKEIDCDYLSLSAHKFYGLKGSGILYIKDGAPVCPLIPGHQEKGRRGGTENAIGIQAMGEALKFIMNKTTVDMKRMKSLRDNFESLVLEKLPETKINGMESDRLCNTSSLTFIGLDAAQLVVMLSRQGIYVSAGAACTNDGQPSHVLVAMGRTEKEAASTIRMSLSVMTTLEEITAASNILCQTVSQLESFGIGA